MSGAQPRSTACRRALCCRGSDPRSRHAVEAFGALVARADAQMHAAHSGLSQRIELGLDQAPAPAARLRVGQEVDMQMRRVVFGEEGQMRLGLGDALERALVERRAWALCRQQPCGRSATSRARGAPRRRQCRALRSRSPASIAIGEHEGEVGLERAIGRRPDVAGQFRIAVERCRIDAAVGGKQADFVERIAVGRSGRANVKTGLVSIVIANPVAEPCRRQRAIASPAGPQARSAVASITIIQGKGD